MPSIRQYRYLHNGENEWLADDAPQHDDGLLKDWNDEWAKLLKESEGVPVEFTEDMYTSSEHSDVPEWINVQIDDALILQYKMARGVIKSIEGARSITFTGGFNAWCDDDWGRIGHISLSISDSSAWITLHAKHSDEEIELVIGEQFNQAIGEE